MRWASSLIAVCACYSPARDAPCTVTCSAEVACPSELVCTNGLCTLAGGGCSEPGSEQPPTEVCDGQPAGMFPDQKCFDAPTVRPLPSILDTDADCDATEPRLVPELCYRIVDVIDQDVHVHGSRALVLWSPTTLTIEAPARLDVASRVGTPPNKGPASNLPCVAVNGMGGGGGAGGTFGSFGGNGGAAFGQGGAAVAITVTTIRGGCPGGSGGANATSGGGGLPGGAVYLMAHDLIHIAGVIDASGAAGTGAGPRGGGGGGGSGGMVGLDAPMVVLDNTATVFAAGGGGASGASSTQASPDGTEPSCCPFLPSGSSIPTAGNNSGGAGAGIGGAESGGVGTPTDGGGGGGGGAGIVNVFGMLAKAGTIVP